MCGRYVRKGKPKKVAELLGVKDGEENWTQSFNVAPSAPIPILTVDPAGRHLVPATWGFISTGRAPLFNARGETVDTLQSFRDSFSQNRCLVPASGFYEWRPSDRQPFYFERCDGHLLAFAGIWTLVGNHMEATVITTTPNSDMHELLIENKATFESPAPDRSHQLQNPVFSACKHVEKACESFPSGRGGKRVG